MAIINGTSAAETLNGTTKDDVITGKGGADTLLGAAGNDLFVWNPTDGNDVVEGDADTDTLRFIGGNVGEVFTMGANGARSVLTRTIDSVTMDVNAVEIFELRTLGGADQVTVDDFATSGVKQAIVDLAAVSGGAAGDNLVDSVSVTGKPADDPLPVAKLLPQLRLEELAGGCAWNRFDEGVCIGHCPLRELAGEELLQFVLGCSRILPEHDDREGSLGPLRMGHGDHGRFGHCRVTHDRVLEIHGTDPFAAGFDEVLRAVGDLDVAGRRHRGHVAGTQPPVFGEAILRRGQVVVAARDPGAMHLDLPHGLAVPGLFALVTQDAQIPPAAEV